jgi:hypothetical protein
VIDRPAAVESRTTGEPVENATSAARGRDLRIDLLRGLCVAKMIFGHLAWRRFELHLPVGWVGAGDGFFLLSGATLGTVARRWVGSERYRALLARLPQRALWLYAVNLLLVVVAYRWVELTPFSARAVERRFGDLPLWLGVLKFDQPLALNVLPRYAAFLAVAPLVLLALRSATGAALLWAASAALWFGFYLSGGALVCPFLEVRGADFPLASWQLLFFSGIVIAYGFGGRPRALARRARTALLWLAGAGTAAFVFAQWYLPGRASRPPEAIRTLVDRELQGPLRLVNLAVVAIFYWLLVDRFREPLARTAGKLLLPLGQNALSAFLLHLPLLWLTQSVVLDPDEEWRRKAAALAALAAIAAAVRVPWVRKLLAPV